MNLQDVLEIEQTETTLAVMAPNAKFDFPVTLTQEEMTESLKKADTKTAHLLADIDWPLEESAQKLWVLDLVATNREIEISESKYRKTTDAKDFKHVDEHSVLAAAITTLQNHKSNISQQLILK